MIPNTVIGVLITVALLTPGFVYLETRERRHPGVKYSALRESSHVIVMSLVSLVASGVFFAMIRAAAPAHTPDIGSYVRQGNVYAEQHYLQTALWFIGTLVVACAFAAVVAVPPSWVGRLVGRLPNDLGETFATWVERRRGNGTIRQHSGWHTAFNLHPTSERWLDVVLIDGTSFHGRLGSASTQIEESPDRDLVLAAPIQVRSIGTEEWTSLQAGTLVISAARISYMTVQYVSPPEKDSKEPPLTAAARRPGSSA